MRRSIVFEPEETFGEAIDKLALRVDALPWWLWPYKFVARQRIKAIRKSIEQGRNTFWMRLLT